jgi:hypothetical protein
MLNPRQMGRSGLIRRGHVVSVSSLADAQGEGAAARGGHRVIIFSCARETLSRAGGDDAR